MCEIIRFLNFEIKSIKKYRILVAFRKTTIATRHESRLIALILIVSRVIVSFQLCYLIAIRIHKINIYRYNFRSLDSINLNFFNFRDWLVRNITSIILIRVVLDLRSLKYKNVIRWACDLLSTFRIRRNIYLELNYQKIFVKDTSDTFFSL